MCDQNTVGELKRQQQQDDGIPLKKRKIAESLLDPMMDVMDVNNDCLEHVFKYLAFSDLLNVADSSKALLEAAQLAYASKYGRKTVVLNSFHYRTGQMVTIHPEDIWIFDFPTCLRILRCFGSRILKLQINYKTNTETQRSKLDQYIKRYCAATLVEIKFCGASENAMKHLKKLEFPKVETVYFEDVENNLGNNLSNLKKCFPNVRQLEFINCNEALSKCISADFPQLEHLAIDFIAMTEFAQENMLDCLDMNPQLRILHIAGDFDGDFLRSIGKHPKQGIESLSIKANRRYLDSFCDELVCFKTVTKFHVQFADTGMEINIPISFEKLDEISLDFITLRIDRNWIDFIGKQKFLSKFVCCCSNTLLIDTENKNKLADALQAAEIVELNLCTFLVSEAINFINKCTSLKHFYFKLPAKSDFGALQQKLTSEWTGSADKFGCVQLERRI